MLLADEHFRCEWDLLFMECRWATAFQSPSFVDSWYASYREDFQPVLLWSAAPDGMLRGLLPLAAERSSGRLVVAGAWQAEYQVWLSNTENNEAFISSALVRIRSEFPGMDLEFRYLPPNTPIDWVDAHGRSDTMARKQLHCRPLLNLADLAVVDESLRKKSNKSKINRLKRIGQLSLVRIRDAEKLRQCADRIANLYDLRQAGMSGNMPFRTDPWKMAFHMALLGEENLLHVTILKVGDDIGAAHLGLCGKGMVHLGIMVLSPFLARHSPGKIHLLLLSKMLREQGYKFFDLTPAGDYKERFANTQDSVTVLTCYGRLSRHMAAGIVSRSRATAKRVLEVTGLNPASARDRIIRILSGSGGSKELEYTERVNTAILQIHGVDVPSIASDPSDRMCVRESCIADLLKSIPGCGGAKRRAFYRGAFEFLARGYSCYTLADDDTLLYCYWLLKPGEIVSFLDGHKTSVCDIHMVLHDPFHLGGTGDAEGFARYVREAAHSIGKAYEAEKLCIVTHTKDVAMIGVLDRLGTRHRWGLAEES